jgi:Calcineurin-like phosphoesterase
MPFSILHISDLHRSPGDVISNDELIVALMGDRDRYSREDTAIAVPEAIVVSGDIIQGVPLGVVDFETRVREQYAVAEEFLDQLAMRFLEGDRSRVVIVPGNHDVDWNTARSSLVRVDDEDIPRNLGSELFRENSDLRWDWKTRTLFRIGDVDEYDRRLDLFWEFFDRFYAGVTGLLDINARPNACLFSLCDDRIGVAAYNSCNGNDCYSFHGSIGREVVARSHLDLKDCGKIFDLQMAVWHHNIDGPPHRSDYMDVDIVRSMIGSGFRLGLYGHQHKTQAVPHQIWLPDKERMGVISAGSLCAGASELPTGVYRQYNVLEISDDFKSVRAHVRSMAVANVFSPGLLMDFGGKSFADLDWNLPKTSAGSAIDTGLARRRAIIGEAEEAAMGADPERAVQLLGTLELPAQSHERELFFNAAQKMENWVEIIDKTNPPNSIHELVQRFDAFSRMNDISSAVAALDEYSAEVELPISIETELRTRAKIEEVIQGE